jgi:hypothetical protein
MQRRRFLFCATAPLALAACGGNDEVTLSMDHLPVRSLGLVPVGTLVFRDSASWSSFWQAYALPSPRGEPVPAVDFVRHAVAGVFAGLKPRCRTLEIHEGRQAGRVVTLRWRIVTFGQATPSSCIGTDFFTANLADLVLIPASAADVVFVDETV